MQQHSHRPRRATDTPGKWPLPVRRGSYLQHIKQLRAKHLVVATRLVSTLMLSVAMVLASCGSPHPQTTTTAATERGAATGRDPLAPDQHLTYNRDGIYVETSVACKQLLVLASKRLTYDAGEIHAMATYFHNLSVANHAPPLPPTLHQVTGGAACTLDMEFANKGQTEYAVDQVQVRLQATPQPNTYPYRLIDVCSAPALDAAPGNTCDHGNGGGPKCDHYRAQIALAHGHAGIAYSGRPTPTDPEACAPTMIVNPSPSAMFLHVDLSGENLIYGVALQVRVVTMSGRKTLTLSQPTSKLIFAAARQFSCYTLKDTTFTLEYSGDEAMRYTNTDNVMGHLCI